MNKFFAFVFMLLFSLSALAQSEKEQLAAQYYQKQEFEKAVDLYEELYQEEPTKYFYDYYLDCLLALNDYSRAKRLVRKQKKNSDFPLKYDVELGYLYQKDGNKRRSQRIFKDAIRDLPSTRQAYIDLANAFAKRDLSGYAIDVLERGNRKINSKRAFHLELASVFAQNGQYREMMEQYLELLDKAPDYEEEIKDELQIFLEDGQTEKVQTVKQVLLEASQKRSSNILFSELLLWFSIQMRDFDIALTQAQALDRRFNEDGQRVFYLAKILADNKKYDLAAQGYRYVLDKGKDNYLYLGSLTRLLDVKFEKLIRKSDLSKSELQSLENEYIVALDQMGRNATTIELMRNLAYLQAFYMNKTDEAIGLLEKTIQMPRARPQQVAESKIQLADILTMQGEVWEATLLYQQVDKAFKDEPLGHQAKLKNARLSFYIGEFDWAVTQLDVLKAATSKLIANDAMQLSLLIKDNIGMDSSLAAIKMYARAELYAFQNKYRKALAILDSIEDAYAGHNIQDEVIFRKAKIWFEQGNYHKTDSLYKIVADRYSDDILADDALMQRARLNEFFLQDEDMAKSLYQRLITDYPGSLYTVQARKRFRYLRGDTDQADRFFENLP